MIETYFAKIVDVLPSRVVTSIPSDRSEKPLLRTFDSSPMAGVIELRPGNVIKIVIETNPGEVIIRYSPANRSDYRE